MRNIKRRREFGEQKRWNKKEGREREIDEYNYLKKKKWKYLRIKKVIDVPMKN